MKNNLKDKNRKQSFKLVCGIECTFDDFSIAFLDYNAKVVFQKTFSLSKINIKLCGGVNPIYSAINHINNIDNIKKIFLKFEKNIEYIYFSKSPGLKINLNILKYFIYGLKMQFKDKSFIGVCHIKSHCYSVIINNLNLKKYFQSPFGYAIFSGGNTKIFISNKKNNFKEIGGTKDISLGDFIQKSLRIFKLTIGDINYIMNLKSTKFENTFFQNLKKNNYFSFTGILTFIERKNKKLEFTYNHLSFCYKEIFRLINYNLQRIFIKLKIKNIVIGGGVTNNNFFRKLLENEKNIKYFLTEKQYTCDNGAMIASNYFI